MGFVVTLGALFGLVEECFKLNFGVVEFCVGVGDFVVVDEEFESFGELGVLSVPFGERGHESRVVDDKGGVETLDFEEMAGEFVDHSGVSFGVSTVYFELFEEAF